MATPRTFRLAPEFGCWPIWDDATGDNLDPVELAISPALVERIRRWDDAFQTTLDPAYPPDSRFPDEAAEAAWRAEGNALFDTLCEALEPDRLHRRARP